MRGVRFVELEHLGSFVVREGRWLVWHMYRKEIGHGR